MMIVAPVGLWAHQDGGGGEVAGGRIERVALLTAPKKPRAPSIQGADGFERAWGEPFKSRTIALQHSPRMVGKAGQQAAR
jgi:hypothetical protein